MIAELGITRANVSHKVRPEHLGRLAYIYIRQSTAKQVTHNQESQHYQRRLSERAESLGWSQERIRMIDSDLAQSGRTSSHRAGFQELVAEVSLGHVGIIFSYEVSRLARNNSDWYHLLDLAAVFDTLIADSDGIYHPRSYNDRLLLGLKGTMSEAELHLLKQRLEAGRMSQVKRGEYRQRLPTGLVRQPDGVVVKDPDAQVQHVIQLMLDKFVELGSCAKVTRYLRREQVLLPRRCINPLQNEILWKVANDSTVYEIVSNPAYAGAFVYGRRQTEPARRLAGKPKSGLMRRDLADWTHIEQQHYPGYISWQQYLLNQQTLKQNAMTYSSAKNKAQGAAREGQALLQGLVVCGCCGHHLELHYKTQGSYRYACHGLARTVDTGICLSVHGVTLDTVVEQAFFEVLRPANLNALDEVLKYQQREHTQVAKQWQQRLQRAEYEARLAERHHQAVDPENRLVAAELEKRWELKLRRWQEVREAFAHFQQHPAATELSFDLKEQFQHLSEHLPQLWQKLDNTHKKELLRSLIEAVIVPKPLAGNLELKIVWVSGHYSTLSARPPTLRQHDMPNHQQLIEGIRRLWEQGLADKAIATNLSQAGFRSARSDKVHPATVQKLRLEQGWLTALERSRNVTEFDGFLTIRGLAEQLGVDRSWISRKIYDQTIPPQFVKRHAQGGVYLIENNAKVINVLKSVLKRTSHR